MNTYTAYIAPRFYEYELANELAFHNIPIVEERGRLFLTRGKPRRDLVWAQNTWLETFFMPIESIGDAVKKLKAIQRNWHCYPSINFRRTSLIEEKLPHVPDKTQNYGTLAPSAPLGAWTLWDNNTLLLSASCSSPYKHGDFVFNENKTDPPSRAYIKLWEVFTLLGEFPKEDDLAIDLGACPGGWTWVMAQHKSRVFALDKSPLDERVDALPQVSFCQGSGFALEPSDCGHINWLLSDMACYPERLFELTQKWLEQGTVDNIIFTIKLQGETDFELLEKFKSIKNSKLVHLSCNKHELTWIYGKIVINSQ